MPPGGILLAQTLLGASARRGALAGVPLKPGMSVVDVGTGFGIMAFELARLAPITATGIDLDPQVLGVAAAVGRRVEEWLLPGSSVHFRVGDAMALPIADGAADLVTVRLVLQHLGDAPGAVREFARVLAPGGLLYILDVDDGLALSWPEPPKEVVTLEHAYASWQAGYGGDREIGRKLPGLLDAAGLEITETRLVSQAHYGTSPPGGPERTITAGRLAAARAAMIAGGTIAEEEFDRCLAVLLAEPSVARFRIESQVVVIGRR